MPNSSLTSLNRLGKLLHFPYSSVLLCLNWFLYQIEETLPELDVLVKLLSTVINSQKFSLPPHKSFDALAD